MSTLLLPKGRAVQYCIFSATEMIGYCLSGDRTGLKQVQRMILFGPTFARGLHRCVHRCVHRGRFETTEKWEITADIYGGVQSRNHSQSDIDRGYAYLEDSKKIGILIWPFMK